MTHICVGNLTIIGSDNGLSPGRRLAIIWTIAGIWLIGPWETNFNEILSKVLLFSSKKMRLKVSSAKWRPSCLGLNVLTCDSSYWSKTVLYWDRAKQITRLLCLFWSYSILWFVRNKIIYPPTYISLFNRFLPFSWFQPYENMTLLTHALPRVLCVQWSIYEHIESETIYMPPGDLLKCLLLYDNCMFMQIQLKLKAFNGQINTQPALLQTMDWHLTVDQTLFQPIVYIVWPHWVILSWRHV